METYRNMNSSEGRCCNQRNREYRQRMIQSPEPQRRRIQDDRGRRMEVECVCRAREKNDCHREDQMEKLGNRFPIAMAYVPWQQWGELYEPDCALKQGTIFKDLNLIFCGVRC